jgi:predicted enzyme related to lactoylglutathione lyase
MAKSSRPKKAPAKVEPSAPTKKATGAKKVKEPPKEPLVLPDEIFKKKGPKAKAPKTKAPKDKAPKVRKPRFRRSEGVLAVNDVPAAVRYYREVLGFSNEWFWGEPVNFGGVSRGDVGVMFHLQPHLQPNVVGHEHYFFVSNIDALYKEHQAAGAMIIDPIADRPWGLREYFVRDLNGYHLRFGESLRRIEERRKKSEKKK